MAISNAERVGKALELLNQGLFPFMKRELKAYYGDPWFEQASANLREYQMPGKGDGDEHWDTQALLLVMWDQWNVVFRNVLGQAERSLVSELRDVRNKWAHQEPFSTDDAYRALDSVQRLLTSVSAADQATEVERQKQELLPNFGGGKPHSMLALYHLVSGVSVNDLPGIEPMLQTAGISRPPLAQRAVLVGTALSPGQAHTKPDGTVVRTLWGDLAWQLLGKDGYDLVAEADRQGVSPGSDVLRHLFATASPCLILIDEWVAHMRQLYGVPGLPAGSFDAN